MPLTQWVSLGVEDLMRLRELSGALVEQPSSPCSLRVRATRWAAEQTHGWP